MNLEIISKLNQGMPAEKVRTRQGTGNMQYRYVRGTDVIQLLNEVFNYQWSFLIKNTTRVEKEIIAHVQLIVPGNDGEKLTKEGIDGAPIKFYTGGPSKGDPVDIGDAYKSAVTGALKKAASLLNIGLDLYEEEGKGTQQEEVVHTPYSKPAPAAVTPAVAPTPMTPTSSPKMRSFTKLGSKPETLSKAASPEGLVSFPTPNNSELISEVQSGAIKFLADSRSMELAAVITGALGTEKALEKLSRQEAADVIKFLNSNKEQLPF